MRKLSRFSFLSLMLAALTLNLANSEASLGSASNSTRQTPRVETSAPQGAPLTFNYASFKREGGRNLLSYSFTNSANRRLDTVHLVALFLDSSEEVKGGHGWAININAASGLSTEGSIELNADLAPTDYVLLTVWKANGDAINFTKGLARTLKAYKRSKGMASGPEAPEVIKAVAQQTNTCNASLAEAKDTCGCGGLKTFSCNPVSGQFSFECFPKNGCDKESAPATPPTSE